MMTCKLKSDVEYRRNRFVGKGMLVVGNVYYPNKTFLSRNL